MQLANAFIGAVGVENRDLEVVERRK